MIPLHSEKEIIALLNKGDKTALSILFKLHYKSLYYFVRLLVDDKKEVAKIVADAFIKLWRKNTGFDNFNAIKTFLYTAVHNSCCNYLKEVPDVTISQHEILLQAEKSDYIESKSICADLLQTISQEIENLSPILKNIFEAIYLNDLTIFEVADQLNLTIDTVRVKKAKALNDLRTAVLKNHRSFTEIYLNGNVASREENEKVELSSWINQSYYYQQLYNEITSSDKFGEDLKELIYSDDIAVWGKVSQQISSGKQENILISRYQNSVLRYAAVIGLVFIISITANLLLLNSPNVRQSNSSQVIAAKTRGSDLGFEITKSSTGKRVISSHGGRITTGGGRKSINAKADQLWAGNFTRTVSQSDVVYNTIKTSEGSYYSNLVLPDSTKVWLSPLSSIRYPVSFNGKERLVEITGEVYFEITKNDDIPFMIVINKAM